MAVAIRCQHGAFFSRALELLAHRKIESVKSAGSSEFLLETLPTEPILNAQLTSLVGKRAGRRGEIAGDLSRVYPTEAGKGLKSTAKKGWWVRKKILCSGCIRIGQKASIGSN